MVSGFITFNYGGGFAIYWSVSQLTLQETDQFVILRKNAESAEFKPIGTVSIHTNHFIDIYPRISYQERPVYQIRIVRNGTVIDESSPLLVDDTYQDQDVHYRMIQNAYNVGLEKSFGNKIFILPRKTWGPACLCTQNPRQLTSSSICNICYGTGIIGGYYSPILTRAEKQTTAKFLQNNIFTLEPNDVVFKILNFPVCKTGDLVVSSTNERYEIISVRPTYIQDKLVSQLIQLRRASGTLRIVYKIEVPIKDIQPDVYATWRPL